METKKRIYRSKNQILKEQAYLQLERFSTHNTRIHKEELSTMWKILKERNARSGARHLNTKQKIRNFIALAGTNPIRNCEEIESAGIYNYILHVPEINKYVIQLGKKLLNKSKYKDKVNYYHKDISVCVHELHKKGIDFDAILWDGTQTLEKYEEKEHIYQKLSSFMELKNGAPVGNKYNTFNKTFIFEILFSNRNSRFDNTDCNCRLLKNIKNVAKNNNYRILNTYVTQIKEYHCNSMGLVAVTLIPGKEKSNEE